MSDILEPVQEAPAAAPVDVPISNPSQPSKAIKTDGPAPEPAREKVSLDDALDRALDKATTDKPAAKTEAKPADKSAPEVKEPVKPEAKEGPARGEGGKFAPKAPAAEPGDDEPPARFSAEAKAAYKDAPEPVRREINRAIKEMTQGIEKYRPAAEFHESLKDYDEQTRRDGTTVKAAMDQYTAISRGLTNPDMNTKLSVIKDIFDHAGINLREFAGAVMGQAPEQHANATDTELRQLRQTVQQLQQQLGGVTGQMRLSKEEQVAKSVNDFAAQAPRFDELAEDIAFFLQSGKTDDISVAYQLAERLNPAPPAQQQAPSPAEAPAPSPAQLNPAGGKSISGSPLSGSDLRARRGPAPSIDEALERAFARL